MLSECRAERDVGAAVGDAPIGEFGNAWAGEADIDDLQFCLVGVGEHADRCLLPCCGGGDLRSDTCGIEADSVPGDAVVGGEDEDADPWLRRGWRTCCDRPPFEKRLQCAEAPGGLDQFVGGVADADRSGRIAWSNGSCKPLRPFRQRRLRFPPIGPRC